jgi:SAM-dependent methyltransferase
MKVCYFQIKIALRLQVLRKIFYLLNPRQRRYLRRLWFLPVDVFSKREYLVPPKGMIYTGAGDFIKIGDKLADRIIRECGFNPDEKILDVGCGIGRIARPFTKFIDNEGAYFGFDIVSTGVRWCKQHYKEFRNFDFKYVEVANDLYNTDAETNDWTFRFPYESNFFDLVVSISVFTHMQTRGVENYLREISRVLKTGKCCFATFFIMNEERKIKFESGHSFFKYKDGDQYLHDARVRDANVAYDFDALDRIAATTGLKIKLFEKGWWNNEKPDEAFDFQDVVVFQKM